MTLISKLSAALVLIELALLCMGGGSLIFLAVWLINLGTSCSTATSGE